MKIRHLFAALALGASLLASAEELDGMYMLLYQGDGTMTAINIDDVDKITFSSTEMSVAQTSGTAQSFPLTSLSSMVFTDESAAPAIQAEASGASISYDAAATALKLAGRANTNLAIYTLDGRVVVSGNIQAAAQVVDLSNLPHNTYVAKYNDQTLKFVR